MTHVQLERSEAPPETLWQEEVPLIDRIPRPVGMVLLAVAFIALWQGVHAIGLFSPIILPPPAAVFRDILLVGTNLATGGYMLAALWITLQEVALGFVIAIAVGFTLGVIVGESSFGERVVLPYLVAIDTMPKVAFAPLFLAWFGFGISSKVALAAFIATFPIVVATAAGLHASDENARMLFKTMGATRWQTLLSLIHI